MNESLKIIACEIIYACTYVQGRRLYVSHKLDNLLLDVGWPRPLLTGFSPEENLAFWEPFIRPMKRGQRVYVSEDTEKAARKYLHKEWGLEAINHKVAETLDKWKHPKQSEDESLSRKDRKLLAEKEKLDRWNRGQE